MYLHIGNDVLVDSSGIIGIFDLDNSSHSKITRSFLANAQKEDNIINAGEDLPKSFIVYQKDGQKSVYLSQLNTSTLLGRSKTGFISTLG